MDKSVAECRDAIMRHTSMTRAQCDAVLDDLADAALAAALPLLRLSDVPGLERQLRDKIAGEIEADAAGANWSATWRRGMQWSAVIARKGIDAALGIARGSEASS